MKFEEALPLLREGKKIRLPSWEAYEYLFEKDCNILTDTKCSLFSYVYSDDLLRDDWEVVEDEALV